MSVKKEISLHSRSSLLGKCEKFAKETPQTLVGDGGFSDDIQLYEILYITQLCFFPEIAYVRDPVDAVYTCNIECI